VYKRDQRRETSQLWQAQNRFGLRGASEPGQGRDPCGGNARGCRQPYAKFAHRLQTHQRKVH